MIQDFKEKNIHKYIKEDIYHHLSSEQGDKVYCTCDMSAKRSY